MWQPSRIEPDGHVHRRDPRRQLVRVALGLLVGAIVAARPAGLAAQLAATDRHTASPGPFLMNVTDPEQRSLSRTAAPLVDWLAGRRSAQLALVVDAADAKGQTLRAMADLLCARSGTDKTYPLRNRIRQLLGRSADDASAGVEIAVVVYGGNAGWTCVAPSDRSDASGPWRFTSSESDLEAIAAALGESVETGSRGVAEETSAPSAANRSWFDFSAAPGQRSAVGQAASVDDALGEALGRLPWSEQTACGRGLLVVGNTRRGPPASRGDTQGDSDRLIRLALQRGVHVVGLLTRPPDGDAGAAVASERESLSRLLRSLCRRTGGQLVDLQWAPDRYWYKQSWSVGEGNDEIAPITPDELRRAVGRGNRGADKPLPRVLVYYSHEWPWSDDLVERDVVAYLLEGVLELRRPESGVCSDEAARDLARQAGARWCIGIDRTSLFDQRRVRLRLARADAAGSSRPVAERSFLLRDRDRFGVFQQVRDSLEQLLIEADAGFDEAARAVRGRDLGLGLYEDVARETRAREAIMEGLWALEESILAGGGRDRAESLRRAESHLARSFRFEPDNPLAHLLMAHCYFNRAQHDGFSDRERAAYQYKYGAALRAARDYSEPRDPRDPIRREITAEYLLMIEQEHRQALAAYEELAGDPDHPGPALRAHWMLAGMYLGDWNVGRWAPELIDKGKAREHIVQILARWPDSPQAGYYGDCFDGRACTPPAIPLHRCQFMGWLGAR